MTVKVLSAVALFVLVTSAAVAQTSGTQSRVPPASSPTPWDPAAHIRDRCEEINQSINRLQADTRKRVVLLGDSITESVKQRVLMGLPIINEGISGEHAKDLALRPCAPGPHELVAKAKPTYVCVMLGINDIWGLKKDVTTVEAEYRTMAQQLRKAVPDAKIIIQSVLPGGGTAAAVQPQIDDLNRRLPKIAAEIKGSYLLLDPVMKSHDGTLRPEYTIDGVHLTEAGTAAWMKRLEEFLVGLQQQQQ